MAVLVEVVQRVWPRSGIDPRTLSARRVVQGELAFEGVEDGFDPLADAAEVPEAGFLIFVGAFE